MKAYPCPVCQGRGCKNCRGSGVLAEDEQGQQFYVAVDSAGGMQIIGPKDSTTEYEDGRSFVDRIFGWIEGNLAEPKDLWWVVKQMRKVR